MPTSPRSLAFPSQTSIFANVNLATGIQAGLVGRFTDSNNYYAYITVETTVLRPPGSSFVGARTQSWLCRGSLLPGKCPRVKARLCKH